MPPKTATLTVIAILLAFLGMYAAIRSRSNADAVASFGELNDEITSLRDELENMQSTISDHEDEISSVRGDVEETQSDVNDIQQTLLLQSLRR